MRLKLLLITNRKLHKKIEQDPNDKTVYSQLIFFSDRLYTLILLGVPPQGVGVSIITIQYSGRNDDFQAL